MDALHGDVGIVNDGDVILALSYSGESEELLNLLPALKRFSVKIISFTGNLKSSLAKHSDVSLASSKCRRKPARSTSHQRAAQQRCLSWATRWRWRFCKHAVSKQKDFAKFHPSGAIGARCCYASAIYHAHEEIEMRIAEKNLSVKEALLVMTHAKSGSSSVVTVRVKLRTGVFWGGDFPHLMAAENLFAHGSN